MFLGILENIQALWDKVAPYLTGITIGGIVSCFFYAFFSGSIKKFINKISIGDMIDKTVDESMEKIKTVTISMELQPLVAQELEKIITKVEESNQKAYNKVIESNAKLIECFGKLASYFDSSIAVPQEIKDDLHLAIDEAKNNIQPPKEEIVIKPIIVEDKKTKKKETTTINVR